MRTLLGIVVALLCSGPIHAQPETTLFDGKTTAGWVIHGDAEVKDGVLILGGNQKTWAKVAADFNPIFELRLEYSTENNKPIQFETHHRHFLGSGATSSSLERTSKKPGEWIEAIVSGNAGRAGNEWATFSKWRVVGEPGFTPQPLGGSNSLPRNVFVGFEIPAGQKLYLRHVSVKTDPVDHLFWPVVLMGGALALLLVIALGARAIVKKRKAPGKLDAADNSPSRGAALPDGK